MPWITISVNHFSPANQRWVAKFQRSTDRAETKVTPGFIRGGAVERATYRTRSRRPQVVVVGDHHRGTLFTLSTSRVRPDRGRREQRET